MDDDREGVAYGKRRGADASGRAANADARAGSWRGGAPPVPPMPPPPMMAPLPLPTSLMETTATATTPTTPIFDEHAATIGGVDADTAGDGDDDASGLDE